MKSNKLFIRRILGSVINFFLIIIYCELLFFLSETIKINISYKLIFIFSFISVFMLPILVLGNTIGYKIMKIYYETNIKKIDIFLKYFFVLLIYNCILLNSFFRIIDLINYYTILDLKYLISIRLFISIIVSSIIFFILSTGKKSFFDYIFRIRYRNAKVLPLMTSLIYPFIFISIFYFSGLIYYKYNINYLLNNFTHHFDSQKYFPIEEISEYSNLITTTKQKTNDIVTFSEISSIISNCYLTQKRINVIINENTYNSIHKRKKLCEKLLYYSTLSEGFEAKNIDQTQFNLKYCERLSFFLLKQSYFVYYYDNKKNYHGIYGGLNPDSLISYYNRINESYYDSYIDGISRYFHISKDTLITLIESSDEGFTIPQELVSKSVNRGSGSISIEFEIPEYDFYIYSFEDIKPFRTIEFSFPSSESCMLIDWSEDLNSKMHRLFISKQNLLF